MNTEHALFILTHGSSVKFATNSQMTTWHSAYNIELAHNSGCETISKVLLQSNLCSSCCVTCCCLIHVCELQGVVTGVFDSLLSHKECFQSLPTATGTKKCVQFPFRDFHSNRGAVLWKKNVPHSATGSQAGDMKEKGSPFMCCSKFQPVQELACCLIREGSKEAEMTREMLFCAFSSSCKHQVVPWWLKFGKFEVGREKQLLGLASLEVRKKKKKKQEAVRIRARQPGMQPDLGMNSSSPPPFPKCHTSLSLFLFHAAFFSPLTS